MLRIDSGLCSAGFALALALCAAPAHAHLVETGLGPVYDGIAHFALTPEDLIPALAVAVLAGLRGLDHARRAIVALPLAWLLGALVGTGLNVPLLASLSWLPLVVLGGLVAADLRLPRPRRRRSGLLSVCSWGLRTAPRWRKPGLACAVSSASSVRCLS